jgi:aryl-alcohol dehydrogenase-like predicted oxidoreductase
VRLRGIQAALEPHLESVVRAAPLSRQALVTLRSVPSVTCVLLGARTPAYVEDALGALALPKLEDPIGAFAAVREA